jgi:hypothetical protein
MDPYLNPSPKREGLKFNFMSDILPYVVKVWVLALTQLTAGLTLWGVILNDIAIKDLPYVLLGLLLTIIMSFPALIIYYSITVWIAGLNQQYWVKKAYLVVVLALILFFMFLFIALGNVLIVLTDMLYWLSVLSSTLAIVIVKLPQPKGVENIESNTNN